MITFFKKDSRTVFMVQSVAALSSEDCDRLSWLFTGAKAMAARIVRGSFIGPRREMITPWSTNAVEISQNLGLNGILRIEEFHKVDEPETAQYDHMLQRLYTNISAAEFEKQGKPAPIVYIDDIHAYNQSEGLALSAEEEQYLDELSKRLGRPLTDSEVFGF